MSTSSQFIQRVEDAVYHAPYLIPNLFKDCKVKQGFVHSRLRRYVPHRVGIEFECFGDFANQYLIDTKRDWRKWESFEKFFGILDFSQDSCISRNYIDCNNKEALINNREEIRVSIQDYRQLNGLYNILKEMAKYCTISDDCGIHIHIDLTKYNSSWQKDAAVNWFNNHLNEVESIFPKYNGNYNKRHAARGKGSWINLSFKDTVEFRIAPLTFDYELLITWIIECSKLVSRMINECHLNKVVTNYCRREKSSKIIVDETRSRLLDVEMVNNLEGPSIEVVNYLRSRNALESALTRDLADSQIEFWIRDNILEMSYPDGRNVDIDYASALDLYQAGGLNSVLSAARDTSHRGSSNNYTATSFATTSNVDSWIDANYDALNYYIYRVSHANNYYDIPY